MDEILFKDEKQKYEEKRPHLLLNRFLKKFFKDRLALFGLAIIIIQIFVGVFPSYIAPHSPRKQNWGLEYQPPNSNYLLGTDNVGRDILSRLIWGSRTALIVGYLVVAIEATIGIILGLLSGFFGGYLDDILMRITDMFLILPSLLVLIVFSSVFNTRSIWNVIIVMGLLWWPWTARITRSTIISVKEEPFVEAARGIGVGTFNLIFQHILPSCIGPILVAVTTTLPIAMTMEAGLSFLGLSDPTIISWGSMLASGRSTLTVAWWVAFFPGFAIFLVTLAYNFVGDGLRDALDIRTRE
jgi:ABC-type dipeptide/oligopeptide/nickel transport system permease subunit